MKKYWFIIAPMAVGITVCVLAPATWQLVGAFCIGGGCYAIIESLKLARIQREIERYERPMSETQPLSARKLVVPLSVPEPRRGFPLPQSGNRPSGAVGWQVVVPRRPRAKMPVYSFRWTHHAKGLSSRAA